MDRRSKLVNREINNQIYQDSLQHGVPVLIVEQTEGSFDPATGENSLTLKEYSIPLAITWASTEAERFSYDIGYLAANKNFTYGGEYQIGDRHMIVAGRYLPNLTSTIEDVFVVFSNDKYKIVKSVKLDGDAGMYLYLRNTDKQRYLPIQHCSEVISVTDDLES